MRKRSRASARAPAISILIDEPRWREDVSVRRLIRRAVRLALGGEGQGDDRGLTILLTNDARLRALNARFRSKRKPTNVLSFPAADDAADLGDIAMAYGVVKREAKAQKKSLAAHAAHLAVHGTLHLRGFNHEKARQAQVMEALETAILAKLGIADPYATRPYTKAGKAA
jgi:probable rRNA maturation factor